MRKKSSLTLLSSRKKKTRAAAARAEGDARTAAQVDSGSSSTTSREEGNSTHAAAAAVSDGDAAAAAAACEVVWSPGKTSGSSRQRSEDRLSVAGSAPGQQQRPEQHRQRRQRQQQTGREGEEEEKHGELQTKRKRQRRKQQEEEDEEGGEEEHAAATAAEGTVTGKRSKGSGSNGSTAGRKEKTRLLVRSSPRPASRWRSRKSVIREDGEEEEDDGDEESQRQRGRSRKRSMTEQKAAGSRGEKDVSLSDSRDADSSDAEGEGGEEAEEEAPGVHRNGSSSRLNGRTNTSYRCRRQANSGGRRKDGSRSGKRSSTRRNAALVEVERRGSGAGAASRAVKNQRKVNALGRGAAAASSSGNEEGEDTEDVVEEPPATGRSAAAGRGACKVRRRQGRGGAGDAGCLRRRRGGGRRKGGSRRNEQARFGRQDERESDAEDVSGGSISGSTCRSGGEAEEKPTDARQGRRGGPGKRKNEKEDSEGEGREDTEQTDCWYDDYFSFNECNVQEELVLDALVATIKKTHTQHYYGNGVMGEQQQEQEQKRKPEEETAAPRSTREERPQREKALSFLASLRKTAGASRKTSAAAASAAAAGGRDKRRDKRHTPTQEEVAAEAAVAAEFEKAAATLRTMTGDALLIKKAWAFVAEDAYETRLAAAAAAAAASTSPRVDGASVFRGTDASATASSGSQRGRRQEVATSDMEQQQRGGGGETRGSRTSGGAAAESVTAVAAAEPAAAEPPAATGAAAEAAGSPPATRCSATRGEERAGESASGCAEGGAETRGEKMAEEHDEGCGNREEEEERSGREGILSAEMEKRHLLRWNGSSSFEFPLLSASGDLDATLAAAAAAAAEVANEEARGGGEEARETGLRARWQKYVLLRAQRVATELRIQDLIRLQERQGTQRRQSQQSRGEQRRSREDQQQEEAKADEAGSAIATGSSGYPLGAPASSAEGARTPAGAAVSPVAAAFLAAKGIQKEKEELGKQHMGATAAAEKQGPSATGKNEEEKLVKSENGTENKQRTSSGVAPAARGLDAAKATAATSSVAAAHPSSSAVVARAGVTSNIAAAASTVAATAATNAAAVPAGAAASAGAGDVGVCGEASEAVPAKRTVGVCGGTAGAQGAKQGGSKAATVVGAGQKETAGSVAVARRADAAVRLSPPGAAAKEETKQGAAEARSTEGERRLKAIGRGDEEDAAPPRVESTKEGGGGEGDGATPSEEKERREDGPYASSWLGSSRSRSGTPAREESSRSHSLPRGQEEEEEGDEEGAAREKEEEEEEKAEKLLRKLTQADADESLTSSSSSSPSSESGSSDEEDSLYEEEDTALGEPPSSPEEEEEAATRAGGRDAATRPQRAGGNSEMRVEDGKRTAAAAQEEAESTAAGAGGGGGKGGATGGRGRGRDTAAATAAPLASEAVAGEDDEEEEEAQEEATGGMRGKGETGRRTDENTDEEKGNEERKREKRGRTFSVGSASEGGTEAVVAGGSKKKKLSTAAKLRLRWEREKQKKRLKAGETIMEDVFARCSAAPLSIDQATKMKNLSVPATLLLRSQCLYTVEDDWESLHCRRYPNGLLRRGTLATHVFRIEETLEFFLFCRFLNLFASTIDIQWTFDSLVAGFACGSPLPPFPAAATAATRRAGGPALAGAAKVGSKDGTASPAETQARVAPEATNAPSSLPEEAGSGSSRSSNGNKEKNGEDDNPSSGNRSKSSNSSSSGASESDGSSSNTGTENLCGRRSGCNNYGNFGSTEMFRLLLQKIFSFVGRRFSPGMSLVRMCGRYVEEKRKEGVLPVGMLWPFDYSFKFGVAKRPATRDKDNGSKDSSSQEGSSRSSDRKESSPTTKKESHTSNKKETSSGAETSSTAGGRGGVPVEERTASVPESTCDPEDKTSGSVSSGSSTNKKNVNQFASSNSSSMRVAREEDEAEVSSGEKVLMESVYNPFKLCDEWNQLKSIHKLRVVRLLIDQVLSESTQIQKARKKLTDADLEMGYKGTDALGKLYWLVPQCGDETVFKLYREDPSTQRVEILCEDIAGLESVAEALGMDEKTADMKDVLMRCHEDLLIQEKQKSREIRRDKARRRQLEISAWGLPSSARRERKPVDYTYAAYDGTIEGRAPAGAGAGSSAEGQRLDRGERLRARQAKKEERMTAEAIEVAESSGETAPTEGNGAAGAGRQAAASSKDLADTKKPARKRQPKGAAVVLRSQADVLRQHQAYLMQHRHHSHFALQQSQALLLSQQLQRMQEEKEAAARQGAAGRMYQPQQQQPLQGAVGNNVGVTCSAPAAVAQLPQAAVAMLQQRLQQVHHHLLQQEGLTAQQRQAALQHACARLQAELLARYGAVTAERTATPQQQQQLIQQHLLRQQQQQQLQARHQLQQQHMMQQHLHHLQEQAQRQQFMHPSQHQQQQVQRQVPHHNVQDCDLIERRAALLQQSYQAQQLNIARGGGGTLPQQRVQPPNYLMATAFNAAVRAANGAPPVSAAAVAANAISSEAAYAGFLRQPVGGAEPNACRTVPVDTVPHAALVYDRADLRMSCSGGGGKEDAMHRKTSAAYIPERRVAPMDASSCSVPPPGTGFSQSGGSANVTIGGGATASSGAPVSAGNIPYAVWASAGGRNSAAVPANVVLSHSTGDHAAAPGRPVGATPASSPYPGLSLSSNAPHHAAAPSLVPLPHAKTSTSHPAAPLPSSSVGAGGIRSSSSQTRSAPQLPCPIPAHLDTLRSSSHALPSRAPPCSTDGERYSVHSLRGSAEPASATVEEGYGTSVNFNGAGDTTDQVKGGGGFKPFADEQQRHHVHGCKSYEGRG